MPDRSDPTEVIAAIYAALEAGDHARVRALVAPDLRWRQAGREVPAADTDLVGAEAVIERVIVPLEQDGDGFSERLDEVFAANGRVVTLGSHHGRHRATGRDLEAEFCHLWEVRDGVAVTFRQFTDTARFAEATRDA